MFKFIAKFDTDDGRLTKGKTYSGGFVGSAMQLRIVVFDNLNRWMTFNPSAFIPGPTS